MRVLIPPFCYKIVQMANIIPHRIWSGLFRLQSSGYWGTPIEYTNWKQTQNILYSIINPTKEKDGEEDDDIILRGSKYLLPLLLSVGDSNGTAKVAGLSDIGTLDGTMGTVLTPKRGRAGDVE